MGPAKDTKSETLFNPDYARRPRRGDAVLLPWGWSLIVAVRNHGRELEVHNGCFRVGGNEIVFRGEKGWWWVHKAP